MSASTAAIGRAFVAGATGYTGREVVRHLRERGIPTVAHVRPDSARLGDWRARFEALGAQSDATAWDALSMAATLTSVAPSVVFALLGTTRRRGRAAAAGGGRSETYESVDYGLTSILLRAAMAAGTWPRFVYLSAVGVRDGTSNAYLAARAKLESELRRSGLPFVIARPSFITGADREEPRPLERGGALIADGLLRMVGWVGARSLADRYRSMTGSELASALVTAALDPACENRTLDAAELRRIAERAPSGTLPRRM